MPNKVKIIHIINELNTGGAEMMLYNLLKQTDRERFDPAVISLMDIGPIGDKIRGLDIDIESFGMVPGKLEPAKVLRLSKSLKSKQPRIIQTWLWHSDLFGTLASRIAGLKVPVVWGLHITELEPRHVKKTSIMAADTCAKLSKSAWAPSKIICCSKVTMEFHIKKGYDPEKMQVINNGIDTLLYKPDTEARDAVRNELGIPNTSVLIGMAARFHPQKDHLNFVSAASILTKNTPDVHFLLCGNNIDWSNDSLVSLINDAGIRDNVHLIGLRNDMPRVHASLDIGTLSSYGGEAFPLVICEVMSCGVPCVVTDVGDSSFILEDTGVVVPHSDPQALADGWQKLVEIGAEKRIGLGSSARNRIISDFSLPVIANKYENLYDEVLQSSSERR
jgi:glycosyltransferase involved in cell wall biosynthesis